MKKRLLISSALMTAVLACALGTGTYAWYQATAGFQATGSTSVSTLGNANLGDKSLTASWTTIEALNLTDVDGNCKVWNGQQVVDAVDSTLVKYDTCTLTLSGDDLGGYAGTYTVKIKATGQVRISTDAVATNKAVGAYTAETAITVGTITISSAGVITYDSVLDINEETADAGLNFNVSVSPESLVGPETSAVGANYGTISVDSIA